MFDHLEGRLLRAEATRLVVGVGGVGYQCQAPLGTGERLSHQGETVRIYTLTVVQEELPRLLGFATLEERELCRLLLRIPGIGPNLALSLLSADSPERLLTAIERVDIPWLTRIKGIGKKTAERICFEAKDRAGTWLDLLGSAPASAPADPVLEDAVQALVSLGFAPADAGKRIEATRSRMPDASTEDLVKSALRGP